MNNDLYETVSDLVTAIVRTAVITGASLTAVFLLLKWWGGL